MIVGESVKRSGTGLNVPERALFVEADISHLNLARQRHRTFE